ncbi:MAG: aminotransferase class I/II-fold pyridoxal phosphate-dependent enzyme [Candidatus Zixiibacteriota bacterium]
MSTIGLVSEDQLSRLIAQIAQKAMVVPGMVLPFVDYDEFLPDLLRQCRFSSDRLISGGHLSPDVAIAADRASLRVEEILGISPFTGNVDDIRSRLDSPSALVYVANPNRVTGAGFSLKDLEMLADMVYEGTLIVDEYYFDYYGISAVPLLHTHSNVVILRSFTASFGISSSNAGYVIAPAALVRRLRDVTANPTLSQTVYRMLTAAMENESALSHRLTGLHNEALRLAGELTRLGIQNRLSPTDFLLLRVGDVKSTGNFLAKAKVPIHNLDGYPQLEHCLRYHLQSELSNNQLLGAFRRMPEEFYRLRGADRRAVTLRRSGETAPVVVSAVEPVFERNQVSIATRQSADVVK